MTKEELIKILQKYKEDGDSEIAHIKADRALIQYIDDPEIKAAYDAIEKWYA